MLKAVVSTQSTGSVRVRKMGDHAHLDTLYNSLPKLMGLNEQEERILRHTITLCKEENKSALLKESFSQLFNEEIGKIQVAAKLLESIPMSGPLTTGSPNFQKQKEGKRKKNT
eukprot:TRINITY_DN768_c0_g1_i5.p2 TRINITY_DN768_c0_g1~~TRINITY_DN768_c0_g1_i5.p2  ORF type:complete len:113 (-),score=33.41 TRINITY_DN768_c0_g1_i5:466-804(-)